MSGLKESPDPNEWPFNDRLSMRLIWLMAGLSLLRHGSSRRPAFEAIRNSLRKCPPLCWRTGVAVVSITAYYPDE